MLSVKKAKEHCGYNPMPYAKTCANCAAFTSERLLPAWCIEANEHREDTRYTIETHGIEKNLRCADHGFAVKKSATCNLFKSKEVK